MRLDKIRGLAAGATEPTSSEAGNAPATAAADTVESPAPPALSTPGKPPLAPNTRAGKISMNASSRKGGGTGTGSLADTLKDKIVEDVIELSGAKEEE